MDLDTVLSECTESHWEFLVSWNGGKRQLLVEKLSLPEIAPPESFANGLQICLFVHGPFGSQELSRVGITGKPVNNQLRGEQGKKVADDIHILLAAQTAVVAPQIEFSEGGVFNNIKQVNLHCLNVELS